MSALLAITGVAKKFHGRRVLSGITFKAERGEAIGVIGPNGAGKTTLLRVIMGLLRADAGSVRLEGEPVVSALGRVRTAYFAGESTLPPTVRVRTWRNLFHDVDERSESRPFR
jgi:ABC-type multidrug transport system ATPase subunit